MRIVVKSMSFCHTLDSRYRVLPERQVGGRRRMGGGQSGEGTGGEQIGGMVWGSGGNER